jgi:hypothetical protein
MFRRESGRANCGKLPRKHYRQLFPLPGSAIDSRPENAKSSASVRGGELFDIPCPKARLMFIGRIGSTEHNR